MHIRIANIKDINEVQMIYELAKADMQQKGLFQWTDNYPNKDILISDIENKYLYLAEADNKIIGAINISEEQEEEYKKVNWKCNEGNILVIHRLVVNPKYQGNGFARNLMDFAEEYAHKNKYKSIRLDAYSLNNRVQKFYKNRDYEIRGEIYFPEREEPFCCMEKKL